MHRPLFMAAFVLLLVSVPLLAQHGGGHASGGGHGFGGGHALAGSHFGSGFASHPSVGAFGSRPIFSAPGFRRSGGTRLRNYGYRNRVYGYGGYGYGYGYPWLYGGIYGGIYDPSWWWNSGSRFDYENQYQTDLANEMNEESLEQQRLLQQSDHAAYARSTPPPPRAKEHSDILPATVLVFRDQHQEEVQNYAIVGQTLWNFAPQHTEKIPLSDLDLPATAKLNDERGVDFKLPGAREGQ